MPRPDFPALRHELIKCGIAPRHLRRAELELAEHFDDLVEDAVARGADIDSAEQQALQQLGDVMDIVRAYRARPELRSWPQRFPHIALVVYPLTCLAALPAVPIIAGVSHAHDVARWAACVLLGGLVTAAILLFLQLTILPA
jgi:hypothetical protein